MGNPEKRREEALNKAHQMETRMLEMKALGDRAAENYFRSMRDSWLEEACE